MSGFIDKCRSHLTDTHPENDETHATTRYAAMYPPELPLQPELPPAQDTLEQKFWARFNKDYLDAIQIKAWEHIDAGEKYISMADLIGELRRIHIYINNNDARFYTDALIEREPCMAQYFHRRARAKGKMKRVYAK